MLELVIPETEQYDEANDRFITTKKQVASAGTLSGLPFKMGIKMA